MKTLKKGFDLKKELRKKHYKGQAKYGTFSFLKDNRDMELEACDELQDAINYLIYLEIKRNYPENYLLSLKKEGFNRLYRKYVRDLENFVSHRSIIIRLIKLINELNAA